MTNISIKKTPDVVLYTELMGQRKQRIVGNVVLTDQAGQQQVAEEGDQRAHARRDEVAERRRVKFCIA